MIPTLTLNWGGAQIKEETNLKQNKNWIETD